MRRLTLIFDRKIFLYVNWYFHEYNATRSISECFSSIVVIKHQHYCTVGGLKLTTSYLEQQKTINYNNQFQLPAYDFTSKSTMILIILFVIMSSENKMPLMDQYKTNLHYVKQNLLKLLLTLIWVGSLKVRFEKELCQRFFSSIFSFCKIKDFYF